MDIRASITDPIRYVLIDVLEHFGHMNQFQLMLESGMPIYGEAIHTVLIMDFDGNPVDVKLRTNTLICYTYDELDKLWSHMSLAPLVPKNVRRFGDLFSLSDFISSTLSTHGHDMEYAYRICKNQYTRDTYNLSELFNYGNHISNVSKIIRRIPRHVQKETSHTKQRRGVADLRKAFMFTHRHGLVGGIALMSLYASV